LRAPAQPVGDQRGPSLHSLVEDVELETEGVELQDPRGERSVQGRGEGLRRESLRPPEDVDDLLHGAQASSSATRRRALSAAWVSASSSLGQWGRTVTWVTPRSGSSSSSSRLPCIGAWLEKGSSRPRRFRWSPIAANSSGSRPGSVRAAIQPSPSAAA